MSKNPINKDEVLRYLGYRNQYLDQQTDGLIDECMEEMRSLIKAKHVYRLFDIDRKNEEIHLKETNLSLQGKDIKNHLKYSHQCILMAVTLGNNVDSKIRYYEKVSMTKALILDACATTAIEEICDEICLDIEKTINKENKALTSRFSPGYGDLPIDVQNIFLSVLGAQKAIGLTASSHSILIPRKSVTAVVGVIDAESIEASNEDLQSFKGKLRSSQNNSCSNCKFYDSCMFRREDGVGCGAYSEA